MTDVRATLTPPFAEFLPAWVAEQRWYPGKGRRPALRRVGGLRLQDPDGEVGIEVHLVADDSAAGTAIYQLPFTYRAQPLPGGEHALVAHTRHSVLGDRWVYDGPHDPAYTQALLRLVLDEGTVESDGGAEDGTATGHRQPGTTVGRMAVSRVLRGEQSNTSIVYDMVDEHGEPATPVICKVFRALQDGENPDVVVQSALASAGSALVPQPVGHLSGEWPDPRTPTGIAHGHLAFAQEFLPGVEDAWRVALVAVAAGEDFSDRARALGVATAQVHATLAQALPTRAAGADDVAEVVAGMRARLVAATNEAPAIAAFDKDIASLFTAAAEAPWPVLQRIHGDYHLGQVLDVPGRGWVLLDFEGEPMRPLAERTRPDLALRDVAGMLRSFDYVAGSWEQAHPGRSAAPWAAEAREAFLDGYAQASGRDPRADAALLEALEVDKALYEVVYEARNRPTWLTIPTTAIARLVNRHKE
ncbi:maltokinase N-terminal cap-like domain-containing protein [Oryzihumus sp.]|uniref:maltokinase N-terminal cap-like domain-containing protein n=1 Tax=Oryzihumus sp. TaxID=1968903 RepID=UPI002EDB4149